jgi:Transposase DDE domain
LLSLPGATKNFMASNEPLDSTLNSLFFNPLTQVYLLSDSPYHCTAISDLDFAKLGVLRCLSHTKTGHEFLQHHADQSDESIEPGHFFKALKSPRRSLNLASINDLLRGVMREQIADPYAQFPELAGFDIYAADGHYQHAAAFDPKPNQPSEKTIATGHFFRLDLRSHHLGYLALGKPDEGKKKAHDITILKRSTIRVLRNGAPNGRRILYVWDKACIDYHLWSMLKNNSGIYFLTQEKSNSTAERCSIELLDSSDPRNEGIQTDHHVGTSNGVMLRRIVYTDPRDGTIYTYLTNEFTLPAYQLVITYKNRWDIEKVFHQLKSKMEERKSWASSPHAKRNHGLFECLAHNLVLLAEEEMKAAGLIDQVEIKKSITREKARYNKAGIAMGLGKNLINQAIKRATQRTVRFIRWLRSYIYQQAPLSQAITRLRQVWAC